MVKLTIKEVFSLGFAYGSFSTNEIDQGIHVILPVVNKVNGVHENTVFQILFEEYFDKIPSDIAPKSVGQAYMDAIKLFSIDKQLDLFSD